MIFGRIRELVGHPGEIANKARLYDQLLESNDPVSARQFIPILVKYSWMMNNLFADIQKVLPPGGTPRRVLYQGPPGSPTGTLYEEVGKVVIEADPPATAEPSQQAAGSRPGSSGRDPKIARSSGARRKSIGSVRTGRGLSPARRTSDRSRIPDWERTPIQHQAMDREQLQIRVRPGQIRPLLPFRRITRWRSQLLLRHPDRPLREIRGLLREGNTRSHQQEAIRRQIPLSRGA